MSKRRLRVIAGPNGSGKSTLTRSLAEDYGVNFGLYVNPDDIEKELRDTNAFDAAGYGIELKPKSFKQFYETHSLRAQANVDYEIKKGHFRLLQPLPARTYFPALFTEYIREQLLKGKRTFSFETVMSDVGKVDFLASAQAQGFKTYLYFVATSDADINQVRVRNRVTKGGHNVDTAKITARYKKSLGNLLPALRHTDTAYIFDNSGNEHRLIAHQIDGRHILDTDNIPRWFEEYVLNRL